jgi:predicted AAA+ superfamily ATPase
MIHGGYPEVIAAATPADKQALLRQLAADYLLKDIFARVELNQDRLHDLLRLLAFQIGSEVSLHELASAVRIDVKTVDRYLGLLEDAYVILRRGGFSRNLRKEVAKSRKIYFLDLGIRNALIQAFQPPPLREDMGRLWENYLVVERHKRMRYAGELYSAWFWRTYDQQEIDYIEERNGKLAAFEFKWNPAKPWKIPRLWRETYPAAENTLVTSENVGSFLMDA